jgi:hypothetical protein
LQPQGLKRLYLEDAQDDATRSVVAESSPLERLRKFAPKFRTGYMGTTIRFKSPEAVEAVSASGKEYETVKAIDAVTKVSETAEVSKIEGVKGQQPAGFVFKPEAGATTLDLLTWNTTESVAHSNASHAERQFFEWMMSKKQLWKQIEFIDIHVSHSPCGTRITETCTIHLNVLMLMLRAVNWSVRGRIVYDTPFVDKKSGTTPVGIRFLRKLWTVEGPPIIDRDLQSMS